VLELIRHYHPLARSLKCLRFLFPFSRAYMLLTAIFEPLPVVSHLILSHHTAHKFCWHSTERPLNHHLAFALI
jgi:hypothetical protein